MDSLRESSFSTKRLEYAIDGKGKRNNATGERISAFRFTNKSEVLKGGE